MLTKTPYTGPVNGVFQTGPAVVLSVPTTSEARLRNCWHCRGLWQLWASPGAWPYRKGLLRRGSFVPGKKNHWVIVAETFVILRLLADGIPSALPAGSTKGLSAAAAKSRKALQESQAKRGGTMTFGGVQLDTGTGAGTRIVTHPQSLRLLIGWLLDCCFRVLALPRQMCSSWLPKRTLTFPVRCAPETPQGNVMWNPSARSSPSASTSLATRR